MDSGLAASTIKQQLVDDLIDAVKECQVRYGGRQELATENDSRVSLLLTHLEAALEYGLKKASSPSNHFTAGLQRVVTDLAGFDLRTQPPVLWNVIKCFLSRHDVERFELLKEIKSDLGRGRAWLRASLNEQSLERHINILLSDEILLRNHYEPWALLQDRDRSSMVSKMAAGLRSILFALTVDTHELEDDTNVVEDITPSPVISIYSTAVTSMSSYHPLSSSLPVQSHMSSEIMQQRLKKGKKRNPKPVNIIDNSNNPLMSRQINPINSPPLSPFSDPGSSNNISVSINSGECDDTLSDLPTSDITGKVLLSPVNDEDEGEGDNGGLLVMLSPVGADNDEDDDVKSEPTLPHKQLVREIDTNSRDQDIDFGDKSSVEELREALIILHMKKEEIEEKNKSLRQLLTSEMELSAGLRHQLKELEASNGHQQQRHTLHIQSVSRENELLKHQLKKYVNAMQMLSRQLDGDEIASSEDIRDVGGNSKSVYRDYSHEAAEYEKKLVQVAEMHGELLEFNDHLRMKLCAKDAQLNKFKEELVQLRGPLPADICSSNDDDPDEILEHVDYSTESGPSRPLINLWIPSTFLQKINSDSHHVYQVFIRIKDEEWNVYRRYSEFLEFHLLVKKRFNVIATFDFPPKRSLGNKDNKLVENRRQRLQTYLRNVMNVLVQSDELISNVNKTSLVNLYSFFSEYVKRRRKQSLFSRNRTKSKTNSRQTQQFRRTPSAPQLAIHQDQQTVIYDGH